MTQAQEHTPQHPMTTMRTLLPSPVNNLQPISPQTCDRCSPAPLGAGWSLMCHHLPELEVLEDHGVRFGVITDSLILERAVHEHRALAQPPPAASQLDNRQKEIHLLLDLGVTYHAARNNFERFLFFLERYRDL